MPEEAIKQRTKRIMGDDSMEDGEDDSAAAGDDKAAQNGGVGMERTVELSRRDLKEPSNADGLAPEGRMVEVEVVFTDAEAHVEDIETGQVRRNPKTLTLQMTWPLKGHNVEAVVMDADAPIFEKNSVT